MLSECLLKCDYHCFIGKATKTVTIENHNQHLTSREPIPVVPCLLLGIILMYKEVSPKDHALELTVILKKIHLHHQSSISLGKALTTIHITI